MDEAELAMVYIGNKKIGTLPSTIVKSKVYSFPCDAVGDFVKIVPGKSDGELAFANIKVYAKLAIHHPGNALDGDGSSFFRS